MGRGRWLVLNVLSFDPAVLDVLLGCWILKMIGSHFCGEVVSIMVMVKTREK